MALMAKSMQLVPAPAACPSSGRCPLHPLERRVLRRMEPPDARPCDSARHRPPALDRPTRHDGSRRAARGLPGEVHSSGRPKTLLPRLACAPPAGEGPEGEARLIADAQAHVATDQPDRLRGLAGAADHTRAAACPAGAPARPRRVARSAPPRLPRSTRAGHFAMFDRACRIGQRRRNDAAAHPLLPHVDDGARFVEGRQSPVEREH